MNKAANKIITVILVVLCAILVIKVMDAMPHGMFFFMPFSVFFLLILSMVIWTSSVAVRFSAMLKKLNNNPCQQTADQMAELMERWNGFTRMLLRSNMIKFGIKSANIRAVYNYSIQPNPGISLQTKQRLYDAFKSLNIWDLIPVGGRPYQQAPRQSSYQPPRTPRQAAPRSQSVPRPQAAPPVYKPPVEKNDPEAGRRHGALGEENVWFDLEKLHKLAKYDVFFDVQLKGSQVDAIVLSPSGGVFLLEIKSWGGVYPTEPKNEAERRKMAKIVSYDPTNGEMVKVSQQINHHHLAFKSIFTDLEEKQVTDMLVISYPHNDTCRIVDELSFPKEYKTLAVHDLSSWLVSQEGGALTQKQRETLVRKLSKHCKQYLSDLQIHQTETVKENTAQNTVSVETSTPSENDFEITKEELQIVDPPVCNYCPHCGMYLKTTAQICGYCGKPL